MVSEREWDVDDFLLEMLHPAWHRDAACRGMDAKIFYPHSYESAKPALTVCADCPVREQCDEAGKSDVFGIWGGKTAADRRHERRHQQRRSLEMAE